MATAFYPQRTEKPMVKKKWYATWWGVTAIIFVLFALTALALFGWQVKRAYNDIRSQALQNFDAAADINRFRTPGPFMNLAIDGRPWLGADQPKVTIVEFIDFNCPVCRASYPVIREIINAHQADVKLIMRHFPVIAETSPLLALASECAHEQQLFWNLHDRFFQTENPAANIGAAARQAGLNMSQFNSCMQERRHEDLITRDEQAAWAAGARGTPTWIINGNLVSGEIPRDVFLQLIDALVQ